MRSPLSSRTNSWPERVTPDEFFDLVASSVVMVLPSVSQLPCLNLPSLALFESNLPPSPVKPGKSRQIVANEIRYVKVTSLMSMQTISMSKIGRVGAPFGTLMNAVHHDVVGGELANAGKPHAISTLESQLHGHAPRSGALYYSLKLRRAACVGTELGV